MEMEQRIAALETTLRGPEGHVARLAAIEKWMKGMDESLKDLVTIAKTLKWVAYLALAVWVLFKTGDPAKLVSLFKGA